MRHVLIAAAALAIGGFASTAVTAQTYQAGGPDRVGNMCKVVTDDRGDDSYGFYAPCGAQALAQAPAVERAPKLQAAYDAGGPNRVGNMCKVDTDDRGDSSFGYYAPCGR